MSDHNLDTPRTNEWVVNLREAISIEYPGTGRKSYAVDYVPASFARQLEREIAALRKNLK